MATTPESDVSTARVQDTQGLLLPFTPQEVCDQIGLNWWAAGQLHTAGFLSFNPEAVEKLDERQEVELRFLGVLVSAGCDQTMLTRLLSGLERPYCYRLGWVYYEWPSQSWRLLPQPPDEPDPDEVLGDWIASLEHKGDVSTLQDIQARVTEALNRLGSSPSS